MAKGNQPSPTTAWQFILASWLHRHGLVSIRQSKYQKGTTSFPKTGLIINVEPQTRFREGINVIVDYGAH